MPVEIRLTLASLLIAIGVLVIIFAVFQAYFYEEELSPFGETTRKRSITEFGALGHDLMWFFTLLTELVGGFFLASIGMKIIRN